MNNNAVNQVLEASSAGAPDMTHALCRLGSGDMGAGIVRLWDVGRDAGHRSGFAKGVSLTSLVFFAGIGTGLFFLRRYHEEKVSQAQIEGIEDFISSGSAAKYANTETSKDEFLLGEMSSNEDWEVIVRRRPNKK